MKSEEKIVINFFSACKKESCSLVLKEFDITELVYKDKSIEISSDDIFVIFKNYVEAN